MGRPGISTSFSDVEKVAKALVGIVEFEPLNPVTYLLDLKKGTFKDPRIKGERALSAIIECKTTVDKGIKVLNLLKKITEEIDTVFTLSVINKCQDYTIPFLDMMKESGYKPRINGKTNAGLGRPLA